VFENRVPTKIFGPWTNEVTGRWRKLHNEELCDLNFSPSIIKIKSGRMRWAGHVARMGDVGERVNVIGGIAKGKETAMKTKM
jgi:hypothetical protein